MAKKIKQAIHEYVQPISAYFVYHPKDWEKYQDSINFCFESLQRDENKPFSRFINIPVFFNTSMDENVPQEFEPKTAKTIVFLLVSKYVIASDNWMNYYSDLQNKNICTIPIALDETALNLKGFENINFIRAYEFDKQFYKEIFLLNIAHEIYRWILNKTPKKCYKTGKEKAVKIFLSHTKSGELGGEIARQIKNFIDNSNLRCFFDSTDIATGYTFRDEIETHMNDATVLVIHSDLYSSRHWCQKEIMHAKENDRPIIEVDCLNEYDDRRFPFATNIAALRMKLDSNNKLTKNNLYKIVLAVLLETLRFHYSDLLFKFYKKNKIIDSHAITLNRPPEISDIQKIWKGDISESTICFYPEPMLYDSERDFYKKLGLNICTPLNCIDIDLSDTKIGISISELDEGELVKVGQFDKHLTFLSQDIARYLLAHSATLFYGGNLRKNGFTQFILDEALILQSRLKKEIPFIEHYVSYPIYLKNNSEDIVDWKAKYSKVVKINNTEYPENIKTLVKEPAYILPNTLENKYIWSRCLTKMREAMIKNCDYRICAGGKHSGYSGIMPGILEETLIAIKMKKPIYLLGGFGGITHDICEFIKTKQEQEKLKLDWQIKNNICYKELLDYAKQQGQYKNIYNEISTLLTFDHTCKNNGLNKGDNMRLFETPFVDEAIHLILKGLKKTKERKKERKRKCLNH